MTLGDARQTEQTRRAQAALGQDIPTRRPTSDVTLRAFLDETYEAWMTSAYGKGSTQVVQIRSAFRDLLDLKLSELTTVRIERWRVSRDVLSRGARRPGETAIPVSETVNDQSRH